MCQVEPRDMDCSEYVYACEYVGSGHDKICTSTYILKLKS